MTQINGFKGFVGYSLKELNVNETVSICENNKSGNSISSIPLTHNKFNFIKEFLLQEREHRKKLSQSDELA